MSSRDINETFGKHSGLWSYIIHLRWSMKNSVCYLDSAISIKMQYMYLFHFNHKDTHATKRFIWKQRLYFL